MRYWYCTHPDARTPWLTMNEYLIKCYADADTYGGKYTVREITEEEYIMYKMSGAETWVGYGGAKVGDRAEILVLYTPGDS